MGLKSLAKVTIEVTLALAVLAGLTGACSSPSPPSQTQASSVPTSVPASTTTEVAPSASAQWTTYGGSLARTSTDATEAVLTSAPTRAWTSPSLDGVVYGEPLIFGGQVLVATENDTVYALSATSGSVLWSDHLAGAVPSSRLPCGDISPTVGITSTMVVDSSTNTLYASAATWNGTTLSHVLFAIDLSNHVVKWSRDLDQPGWVADDQLQRAGLAIDDGKVLVAFGGNFGDCGMYHGWVVGAPESGSGALATYRVPTANQGAIWAPAGPSVDPAGNVYVATGNGSAQPGQPFDHGDAVIDLSPGLTELQYWAPADWAQLNVGDKDLGSTTPVLLGNGELFEVGKGGVGYLLDSASLGGVGGPAATVSLCDSRGATAYASGELYVVCSDNGTIEEITVGPGATLSRGWTWSAPSGGASSPTVARGSVWVVDQEASVLFGIDPATGATRWSLPLDTGTPPHFAGVSAGDGLLVVAGSKAVEAFH